MHMCIYKLDRCSVHIFSCPTLELLAPTFDRLMTLEEGEGPTEGPPK